jgi:hypothetical protein
MLIRTIRPLDRPNPGLERVAKANGFSLHAGVSYEGHQTDKRERLCRYIARPAVAIPRLSLSSTGKVVYTLKTPYRDGKGSPCPTPSGTANQGATCHAVSFRRDGVSSAGMPLKTPWHGLLRTLVQEWTNMNCTITSANNFSGQ